MKESNVKRYEGLFILNLAGQDEGLKEAIDKLTREIDLAGGKVENVQKMDKKPFARPTRSKQSSGHFVNVIFEAQPSSIIRLHEKFRLADEVFRVVFSIVEKGAGVDATKEPVIATS